MPPPPPQTAHRLYGATRDELRQEFGDPCVSYGTKNTWSTYEKDNTEIRVRFDGFDKADFVLATSVAKDTDGITRNQYGPPINAGRGKVSYAPALDEL